VQYFWIYKNSLTGSIPSSLSTLTNILDFWVSFNRLTGTIPRFLASYPYIDKIIVRDNRLTGELFGSDSTGSLQRLSILDVSGNLFSGSIPSALFSLPNLRTVALTRNCFSGELPATICNTSILEQIIMDGLSSGEGCPIAYKLLGYEIPYFMSGDIPACMWSNSKLKTMHLSANGFGGTISPRVFAPGHALRDLNVAHNKIWGSLSDSLDTLLGAPIEVSYKVFY